MSPSSCGVGSYLFIMFYIVFVFFSKPFEEMLEDIKGVSESIIQRTNENTMTKGKGQEDMQ